ncbi:hypothetical protein [Microbacterium sp. NPDC078849]|uniref:hypothetical protein n=1 Tax=unclassified Microbacterium TaxID=2609290 RepID=UPI00344EE19B
MATGYTAPIKDNQPITFAEFALRCSRAMGVAIMQRDEPLEAELRELTLQPHYSERVESTREALQAALDRSVEEWAAIQEAEAAEMAAVREAYITEKEALRARYTAMLRQVRAWTPPTPEHIGLRAFMIEQLEQSIAFDCGDWEPSRPVAESVDLYSQRKIGELTRQHADAVKQLGEERGRVASQNAWVRALRESLTRP